MPKSSLLGQRIGLLSCQVACHCTLFAPAGHYATHCGMNITWHWIPTGSRGFSHDGSSSPNVRMWYVLFSDLCVHVSLVALGLTTGVKTLMGMARMLEILVGHPIVI